MADKKPKGAKSPYACFSQICREEQKKENPDNPIDFTEFSKNCSERWKNISEKDKKKYVDIAAIDKERYLREMENYEPNTKTNSKTKRKATKDPNKPKQAWSAFFFFCDEHRKAIKDKNPDYKVGDVAKVLGKMWSACKDKSKYEEMNRKDKERYAKEIEAYKNGAPASKKSRAAEIDEVGSDEDDDDIEEDE